LGHIDSAQKIIRIEQSKGRKDRNVMLSAEGDEDPWTKEDVRMLKALAREKTKTTMIARKLKRSVGALHQKAMRIGVTLGARRKKKRA